MQTEMTQKYLSGDNSQYLSCITVLIALGDATLPVGYFVTFGEFITGTHLNAGIENIAVANKQRAALYRPGQGISGRPPKRQTSPEGPDGTPRLPTNLPRAPTRQTLSQQQGQTDQPLPRAAQRRARVPAPYARRSAPVPRRPRPPWSSNAPCRIARYVLPLRPQ